MDKEKLFAQIKGRFVLFFPTELHKPGLVQHGCVGVRKAVVKIRMED